MATHVQQITGGNVEGLEHCPPTYHFDLSMEEFEEFQQNPEATFRRLGIPVPKHISIDLDRWDEAYSETDGEWQARPPRGSCCVTYADGGTRCHGHC